MLTKNTQLDIKVSQLYGPISRAADSATTTTAINRQSSQAGSLVFVFSCGTTGGSNTMTPSFTESDTLGGSYTAVANSDLSATPTVFTATDGGKYQAIAYLGSKAFVKAVVTQASNSATLFAIYAIESRGTLPMGTAGLVAAI